MNKAKGFEGCGELIKIHRAGLCDDCFANWLQSTEQGKQQLRKAYQLSVSEHKSNARKEKTESKRALLSVDAYRAKVLQPVINEIARLIDEGLPCIASGVTIGKFAGGHFTSVGANRSIALNLHNIHKQAYHSNAHKGGQPIEYLEGLRERYGDKYAEFVLSMRKISVQKFNKQDLTEAFIRAQGFRKWLKSIDAKDRSNWSALDRINSRNEGNKLIGLYSEFDVFLF
jgi:hypothetical protein